MSHCCKYCLLKLFCGRQTANLHSSTASSTFKRRCQCLCVKQRVCQHFKAAVGHKLSASGSYLWGDNSCHKTTKSLIRKPQEPVQLAAVKTSVYWQTPLFCDFISEQLILLPGYIMLLPPSETNNMHQSLLTVSCTWIFNVTVTRQLWNIQRIKIHLITPTKSFYGYASQPDYFTSDWAA